MTNDKKIEFLEKLKSIISEYGVEIDYYDELCINFDDNEELLFFYLDCEEIKSKIKELECE